MDDQRRNKIEFVKGEIQELDEKLASVEVWTADRDAWRAVLKRLEGADNTPLKSPAQPKVTTSVRRRSRSKKGGPKTTHLIRDAVAAKPGIPFDALFNAIEPMMQTKSQDPRSAVSSAASNMVSEGKLRKEGDLFFPV